MSNTVTSAFIDLATFDEIEKYLYNGPTAVTYFVRCVKKATWFAQVPVPLTQNAGTPDFNGEVAFQISRAGDYLLHVWLRATLPEVSVYTSAVSTPGITQGIRWCANVGHNLIELAWITFNDLKVQEFDSFWLDMWSAFTVDASKRNGYNNMIGNILDLTQPTNRLPAYNINVPLPFFFTRDSGIALPTAALPYNEMRIQFNFRDWRELLILDGVSVNQLQTGTPKLSGVQLWANYAVVSNEERVKMGKCPRDMVIEQVQRHGGRSFNPPDTNTNLSYDIRFSHSIKALFWSVANTTILDQGNNQAREWSNYTTGGATSPANAPDPGAGAVGGNGIVVNGDDGSDPISLSSLLYENTFRLWEMASDYFSLVQPWYHFPAIPESTGYHAYSFALDPQAMDPSGSTNFGKLTNVSLQLTGSDDAVYAAGFDLNGSSSSDPAYWQRQTFQVYIRGLNFNIVRISGGEIFKRREKQHSNNNSALLLGKSLNTELSVSC